MRFVGIVMFALAFSICTLLIIICMYPFVQRAYRYHTHSLSFYSSLIKQCLSYRNSFISLQILHGKLIKLGFNRNTFLGNCCIDLYSKHGAKSYALKVFDEIPNKNVVSWNMCVKVFIQSGDVQRASRMFDEMPDRDVVSWNSMISGYASYGLFEVAFGVFLEMQNYGIRPSGYTFSILISNVQFAFHGKEIHGNMLRSGVDLSNVVVGNSLIDMYGNLGLVDYGTGVFLAMEEVDVVSWNSLISVCCKSGREDTALSYFCLMRACRYSPDEFTMSSVLIGCSNLRSLEKGKQILCLCIKMGVLCNTIVSSAAIDLFSNCNRIEDSVRIFEDSNHWDTALCNSMISSYALNSLEENALRVFVLTLRENIRPTEFTLSCILSCATTFPMELGIQAHSLVIKLGFVSDPVVSSSVVDMYCKYGLIDSASNIFNDLLARDLISWNTMIFGLAINGELTKSLSLYYELLEVGGQPDRITLAAVLLACSYGGFIDEGIAIFSSMEEEYGVRPGIEHYTCVVGMMTRAGKLKEAGDILQNMPHEPNSEIWESILLACDIYGDLKETEKVAGKIMEIAPESSLPYLVLAQVYESRGRWESLVRVRKVMEERVEKKVTSYSWISVHNCLKIFQANQMLSRGSKDIDIYSTLRLLTKDIWYKGYA
ncbi:pentatricopeptide repeat-containing protein At1g43980, mitochondrial [Nicotiana tomentosiformis]|uniref:pentatricopeptide repeat-containing protein At1g43980, mitochondrial n=1 Tax=Nicotiana tomentosiformis TaxID=4098 RepID=UPI00051C811B|nr:pentatricopeptide repeat-containing protein At1g43980, mitochondrial [Nicotiana tomentosiformis]